LENNNEIGNVDEIFGLFNAYVTFLLMIKNSYFLSKWKKDI